MTDAQLPLPVGRPKTLFSAFATPVGKPRWSEDRLRERWRRLCNQEGHKQGVPPDRPKHQWSDGLTETERKILIWHQDKGWPIAKIAAKAGVSQQRAQAVIDERKAIMQAIQEAFQ